MGSTFTYILLIAFFLLLICFICICMDLNKKVNRICKIDNCAHYTSTNTLHLYKHKFVYAIVFGTFAFILIFIGLSVLHDKSQQTILKQHQESCENLEMMFREYANSQNEEYSNIFNSASQTAIAQSQKQIESLLELQFEKLQSDFNFISLWAGLLTIVFLIFSIYSMFKTDEMQKQAQEMLRKSEDSYNGIKVLAEKSEESLEGLEELYATEKAQLDQLYKDCTNDYENFKSTEKEQLEGIYSNKFDKLEKNLQSDIHIALENISETPSANSNIEIISDTLSQMEGTFSNDNGSLANNSALYQEGEDKHNNSEK